MEQRRLKVELTLYFLGDPEPRRTVINCRWHEAAVLVADWIRQAVAHKERGRNREA